MFKAINKFRSTNTFCLTGFAIEDIAALHAHYGQSLNSVAHDDATQLRHNFIVRVCTDKQLYDARVRVECYGTVARVVELERNSLLLGLDEITASLEADKRYDEMRDRADRGLPTIDC